MGRKVKNYTDEFKKQIVALNKNGKTIVKLAEEYGLAKARLENGASIMRKQVHLKQLITEVKLKMNFYHYVKK